MTWPIVLRGVPERMRGDASAERAHHRLVRDGAERQHRLEPWECAMVGVRNCRQVRDLRADRLVLGRHAAHRIGDRRADQRQPVVGPRLIVALGEAERDQRAIEQVAGDSRR